MEETDWRELINDPQERKVFEALEDERWDWRTVGVLSRVSGLSTDEVRDLAAQHRYLIRKSHSKGRELFTLQTRYYAKKRPLEKAWDYLSSSSS